MFFNRAIKTTRTAPGQYVDGIWQDGESRTLYIQTSVQPSNDNDVKKLPEGRRQNKAYTLYSAHAFKAADDTQNINADVVEIYGERFEIMHSETWCNNLINHHMAIAVKDPENDT